MHVVKGAKRHQEATNKYVYAYVYSSRIKCDELCSIKMDLNEDWGGVRAESESLNSRFGTNPATLNGSCMKDMDFLLPST